MLCSNCNKNTAVIFINKEVNGKQEIEGLCFQCAQEKGINPLEVLAKQSNLSEKDLENMSRQFENIFKNLSDNLENSSFDDLSENSDNSLGYIC